MPASVVVTAGRSSFIRVSSGLLFDLTASVFRFWIFHRRGHVDLARDCLENQYHHHGSVPVSPPPIITRSPGFESLFLSKLREISPAATGIIDASANRCLENNRGGDRAGNCLLCRRPGRYGRTGHSQRGGARLWRPDRGDRSGGGAARAARRAGDRVRFP